MKLTTVAISATNSAVYHVSESYARSCANIWISVKCLSYTLSFETVFVFSLRFLFMPPPTDTCVGDIVFCCWCFILLFWREMSGVPRPIAIKLSHMLGSECNLRNWARDLGALTLKIWGSNIWKIGDPISNNSPSGGNFVYFGPLTKKLLT